MVADAYICVFVVCGVCLAVGGSMRQCSMCGREGGGGGVVAWHGRGGGAACGG